ncbi:MAG: type II toxin-antitoxin system PemK/MazF family toxin [Spirochaetes bacterium]|nr:type II toxin-antitoxin system PemK/MazF family toxin [Spirochaetota bacterium]
MKRGDLYRVYRGSKNDPKKHRVFLVVSRQTLIDQSFSSVICAPVYTNYRGFSTQVEVGVDEGLKHESTVFCDDLISIPKSLLTDYIGSLSSDKIQEVNTALRIALAVG